MSRPPPRAACDRQELHSNRVSVATSRPHRPVRHQAHGSFLFRPTARSSFVNSDAVSGGGERTALMPLVPQSDPDSWHKFYRTQFKCAISGRILMDFIACGPNSFATHHWSFVAREQPVSHTRSSRKPGFHCRECSGRQSLESQVGTRHTRPRYLSYPELVPPMEWRQHSQSRESRAAIHRLGTIEVDIEFVPF